MAFKEQLEILTALLDPEEGATESFNEAIEEIIDAMASDETQIPDEGDFEASIPVIQNFISHFKSRHQSVDKYVNLILRLRPDSLFGLALQQTWYEKFPQVTVEAPLQKKRKKNIKNEFEKFISKVEEGNITKKQLIKLINYAQIDEYFERACENFAVYFDPDLIDAEDEDLTDFYDLFLPENDYALPLIFEWLDSDHENTFHLALNIIEQVIPTGEFSFDSAVLDKLFTILNSKRVHLKKEFILSFSGKLKDIITTVFLQLTYPCYQNATGPQMIDSLAKFYEKIEQAQGIVNALVSEKKAKNAPVGFDSALLASWQVNNNTTMTMQMDSTNNAPNNAPNHVATFNDQAIAFNAKQHNPSILFLLGINMQQYLNALIDFSNVSFVREKFAPQMRAYYLSINASAYDQNQEAAEVLLQHPLMKNNRLKVDDEYIKKLIDSNDDDDDSLNDLESLYKEYIRKQRKMDDTINTKETFVNAIQNFGEQFYCEDQDIVFAVAAKNNINLCLWEQTKNNELALSGSMPYATSEPVHILKQDGEYIKLNPLESYVSTNKNQNRS